MRESARLLEWNGLEMVHTGEADGVVASQSVAPGTKVQKESKVSVNLARKTQGE